MRVDAKAEYQGQRQYCGDALPESQRVALVQGKAPQRNGLASIQAIVYFHREFQHVAKSFGGVCLQRLRKQVTQPGRKIRSVAYSLALAVQ